MSAARVRVDDDFGKRHRANRRAERLDLRLEAAPPDGAEAGTYRLYDTCSHYVVAKAPRREYGLTLDECLAWLDREADS